MQLPGVTFIACRRLTAAMNMGPPTPSRFQVPADHARHLQRHRPGLCAHRARLPAVRFRLYPGEGVRGLVAFVNNFATPCLLFQAMLTSDFGTTFNPAVIVPFYIGALFSLLCGALIARRVFGNRPGESVSSGFSAMFTNTVLIGIPIIQRAYGDGGAADGLLDHRLPRPGADHPRHAGHGTGAPRRRAAAKALGVAATAHRPEPAALGRRPRRCSATASASSCPSRHAFLDDDGGGGAAGGAVRPRRRAQRIPALRELAQAARMSLFKLIVHR